MASDKIIQDKLTIMQILGCIIKNPNLLNDSQYKLVKTDFPEVFHRIVFATVNNLVRSGVVDIDLITISSFLSKYPDQYKIFEDNHGLEYLDRAISYSSLANFHYHYERLKKFSLLRDYQAIGIDVSDIYDPLVVDGVTCESMQEKFDEMSITDIINHIDKKQMEVKEGYLKGQGVFGQQAGFNMRSLKERLKETPEMGMPLCSDILNTIFRGARLKKLYMRSAPTGVGKTRLSVGDAVNLAVDEIYNSQTKQWQPNNTPEPSLFITSELNMDEIQTMMMAFVSDVKEGHILDGEYKDGEEERVDRAIEIIERSPLYIEHIPNFDISDIEQVIKKYVLTKGVKYIFFDYVHTTMKLLEQLSKQSKGMKLREDNVLLMFVDKLKSICNDLGVFIYTSTQLNGDYKNMKDLDQNVLRGAKSIADKLDCGMIAMDVTNKDIVALRDVLGDQGVQHIPNMVYHIYKNRRGKMSKIKVWVYVDLATCRTYDCFVTDKDYKFIPMERIKIMVDKAEKKVG